jgi:transcription elongation GreA/GreB family factor
MTTSSHEELTASTVISMIESGAYPREIVATIARGFLPLAQDDLVAVLAYLGSGGDPELAELARASLGDVPSRVIVDFAADENAPPEYLERLLRVTTDPYVLEALIRNRGVPDHAVADLARRAEPRVQEVIVINHARILRAPEILDALLENPGVNATTRRLVHEVREEFFLKKARREEEEPEILDIPLDPIADLLERAETAAGEEDAAASTVALSELEKKDERASVVWTRLQYMSVSEKVRLAFRGDRMIRMLLVRDRNKLICAAVMRNPRMSEQEAEAIAGMRNVDDEVLRILGTRRDWTGKYKIIHTLVRNPKAPVGVVLPFINRLTLRDLKGLKDDKGVQQVVREMARKVYLLRARKQSG